MAMTPARAGVHSGEVNIWVKLTMLTNVLLLVFKIVTVSVSGSMSVLVTAFDSLLDCISSLMSWILVSRFAGENKIYKAELGRGPVQTTNVLITATVMLVGSLFMAYFNIKSIIEKSGLSEIHGRGRKWIFSLSSTAFVVLIKLVLYIAMRGSKRPDVRMLSKDHLIDVIVNSATVAVIATYSKYSKILDGIVGLQLCAMTCIIWLHAMILNLPRACISTKRLEVDTQGIYRILNYEDYSVRFADRTIVADFDDNISDNSTKNIEVSRLSNGVHASSDDFRFEVRRPQGEIGLSA